MTARLLTIIAATIVGVPYGCTRHSDHSQPITNDAYVWQRRWSASLLTALTESASSIREWRVLAAEVDSKGHLAQISVNREALRRMAKPLIAVIRIDSHGGTMPLAEIVAIQAAALVANWKKEGLPVSGIEIDYDCATNRLANYRDFLQFLRARLSPQMTLSITALPTWMESRDLPRLLAQVDEAVLQVHSVMSPTNGLFNRAVAFKWARAWSAQSSVPFRIALPAYWSQVTWDEAGRVVAIESEVARYGGGEVSHELFVEPGEVSSFVAELRRESLRFLRGIAWFRLPTEDDRRAWSSPAWHAVMEGRSLPAAVPVVRVKADHTGARDIYLVNESDLDGRLPAQVLLSARGCEFAGALPPYTSERETNRVRFRLNDDGVLRAGQQRLLGWIRCAGEEVDAHVYF